MRVDQILFRQPKQTLNCDPNGALRGSLDLRRQVVFITDVALLSRLVAAPDKAFMSGGGRSPFRNHGLDSSHRSVYYNDGVIRSGMQSQHVML